MTPIPSRQPTPLLLVFGLVNLPPSMLMSPTASVLPNFYLEYSAATLAGLATATLAARILDGLTDPLIGYPSNRSACRSGCASCGERRSTGHGPSRRWA